MGRTLFNITPSIVTAAREYLALANTGELQGVHVAECFPVPPDDVVRIWDDALFDLRRRGEHQKFGLASVAVFKNGTVAAQYYNLDSPAEGMSLFTGLD